MSPDLPKKLLGIDTDDPSGGTAGGNETDEEELERFVFVLIGDQRLALSVDDVKSITRPPVEITRVPRAPDAIEGVVDIRGEITVVIEPRIHFPVTAAAPTNQRLLVLDRPSDQQPAAIRVDDVLGVETIPVTNVLEETDGDDAGPLEHPLVVGLVEKETYEREPDDGSDERERLRAPDSLLADLPGAEGPAGPSPLTAARQRTSSEEFDVFEDEDEVEADETEDEEEAPEPTVETTPLVDVERLLLASGHVE
ncbi:chemotaxis protein CheW [Natronobiforma cellulositropha]|uniref:chemotaxis protein CheW n=1 Tax=Natronobiforma cellulositropha TaxID=1679076 RepID=UPI0021D57F1C|nr:chemotaxis protein CheW [Natronobiforma cellulositropha]